MKKSDVKRWIYLALTSLFICLSLAWIDRFLQTNFAVFGIMFFVFTYLFLEMTKTKGDDEE